MRKAVINTATGAVIRYGYCDFSTDGSFDGATQTQVDLNEDSNRIPDIPIYHNKIVAGGFAEMSQAEKDAVDAAREATATANLDGSVKLDRVVNSTGDLPLPPPKAGLMVGVVQRGQIGLAISGPDRWFLIAVDAVVGP